ncbi:MAG TPA: protein kinase [Thermoanaerobaculia bacterium]|jgi:CheY-like chemotaxis protein
MSVILVVETDASYARRLAEALEPAGLPVAVCDSAASALGEAAVRPPRLLVASSAVPEVRSLLGRFARGQGGPGAVVMIPTTLVGRVAAGDYRADALLPKPFTAEEARDVLMPLLSAPPEQRQLSSAEIFGEVLAEVEGAPYVPPAIPPRPPRPSDDIDRKLEETLSGVLPLAGGRPRPAARAAPPGAAKAKSTTSEIDALLDRTLSSLELPSRNKKRAAPGPAAPGPAAPRPAAPGPAAASLPASAEKAPARAAASGSALATTAVPPLRPPAEMIARPPAPALPERLPDLLPLPSEVAPPIFEPPPPLDDAAPRSAAAPSPPPPATRAKRPAALDQFRTQQMTIVPPRDAAEGEVFGDYTLIRRIAVGGMAEVWQARRRGVEGFQKTVAIKKILCHLTGSSDFVTMFIDEAKLAAQLNHNNIIQIYDLGKVDEDFFIAMEYVDGMDLRTILNTARDTRRPLPMGLALLITSSVARALDYAHRKRDFDNRALGLVHRDVSPQNVLISFEGEIKLCDFGIVKAVAKASTTQMGALKGKLQYMSPEQAWGKPVDARSDVFSLGSVFFEMLTGTRLFSGESEIGVLDAVRECRLRPPRELVPAIPEEVDRIVRRALAKSPEERYQTAGEMEEDLKQALHRLQPLPSQSELARYMHALAAAPEPAATPPEPAIAGADPARGEETAPAAAPPVPVLAPAEEKRPAAVAMAPAAARRRRRPLVKLLAAAAAVGAIGAAVWFFLLRAPDEGPPPATLPEVAPQTAPPAGDERAGGEEPVQEPAPPPDFDLKELVDQEMARRAEALRQEFEARKRRLERELEEARKAAAPPPNAEKPPPGGGGG